MGPRVAHQSVPVAEANALHQVLTEVVYHVSAVGPSICDVDIAFDCQYVVEAINDYYMFSEAQGHCKPHATLWKSIACKWRDLKKHDHHVIVRWIPAHQTDSQVEAGVIIRFDRDGNDKADHYAKLGAKLHRLPKHVVAGYNAELDRAMRHNMQLTCRFGFNVKHHVFFRCTP